MTVSERALCATGGTVNGVSAGLNSVFGVAGNEEIAHFLLQNGAGFSSYTLMDHPAFSKHLLRLKLQETNTEGEEVCVLETKAKGNDIYYMFSFLSSFRPRQ